MFVKLSLNENSHTQAAEILYFKNAPACVYQMLPEFHNIEIVATLFPGKMHERYKKVSSC